MSTITFITLENNARAVYFNGQYIASTYSSEPSRVSQLKNIAESLAAFHHESVDQLHIDPKDSEKYVDCGEVSWGLLREDLVQQGLLPEVDVFA